MRFLFGDDEAIVQVYRIMVEVKIKLFVLSVSVDYTV